jgi:two-component system, NarL family, response regulator LiaR
MENGKVTVVLADDHPMTRRALKVQLEGDGIEVVGEAANGREAVRLARSLRPDVVLLDQAMPELDGLGAARALLEDRTDHKIILLTSDHDASLVAEAARVGARGFVLKDDPPHRLVEAVHRVKRGGTGPRIGGPPDLS